MKKSNCVLLVFTVVFFLSNLAVASDEGVVAWWDFERVKGNITVDKTGEVKDVLEGSYKPAFGVVGLALKMDGYSTCIRRKAQEGPKLGGDFTVEAWLAFGAYPWNWCPVVTQSNPKDKGFSFLAGPRGQVRLELAIDEQVQRCTSEDFVIPLWTWVHVVGIYDKEKGIAIYVNGKQNKVLSVKGQPQFAPETELRIGMNYEPIKPSNIHREHGTLPGWFSLDGIIDEVRIFNRALTAAEVELQYSAHKPSAKPDLQPRIMPSGPKGPGRFGAYYCHLKYYDEWDNLWAVGPDPDVLVRFDESEARVVFWRGSRYSPAWVSENGLWMADQSVEAWGVGRNDREGCFEHMQDRRCRYSRVRVIESHDARAVVHWRYAPVSSYDHLWREDPKTGRACWVDEYYYIYPDTMGVRKVTWKTGTLGRPRQFQESLPFTHPGQLQGDVINLDFAFVANLKGENEVISFVRNPQESKKKFPGELTIQMYNFKSQNKPFIIFEPGNRMHYIKDRGIGPRGLARPGGCNHWPVGQMLCDGRTVQAADRPTHFLGFPISSPPLHEKDGRSWWNGLYGMTDKTIEELVMVARSWARAPELTVKSKGFISQGYDRSERAYQVTCKSPESASVLECKFAAGDESPICNIPLVVRSWGDNGAGLEVNGRKVEQGRNFRVGHRHLVDGSNLVVWIKLESTKPVSIRLTREGK